MADVQLFSRQLGSDTLEVSLVGGSWPGPAARPPIDDQREEKADAS